MIDRDRPKRPPFVPRVVYVVAGLAVLLPILVASALLLNTRLALTEVPELVGVQESEAEARLNLAGLEILVADRVFDPSPAGTVLEQEPVPGATLGQGEVVTLRVSAGIEEFILPDVMGYSILVARSRLEGRGLVLTEDSAVSDQPMGTVVSTNPSPGATVRTGDIVRVFVATAPEDIPALVPLELSGKIVVLDPAPVRALVAEGEQDVANADPPVDPPLEVARRLRSLFEAAGARVIITRSVTSEDISLAARSALVTGTVSAVVGIDVVNDPQRPGIDIRTVNRISAPQTYDQALSLTRALSGSFAQDEKAARSSETVGDAVTTALPVPAVRIALGSQAVTSDAALLADPRWSDAVARSIYRGLGEWLASQ